MFAKLKHVAIVSDQYTLLGRFYEGMFGMKPSQNARPFGAGRARRLCRHEYQSAQR